MLDTNLINEFYNIRILGIFKTFCEANDNSRNRKRLRNIMTLSQNKTNTIKEIFKREYRIELNESEALRMNDLIKAFLNKSNYRKSITNSLKTKLLENQKRKCAICSCNIDIRAHADHIVPFKYVGDCLENNWQLLCKHCNEAKNDSLDYQIRHLLRLTK